METETNQSSLKNIIAAICAFQGELVPPKKETDNPYFKSRYADLAGVWESCRVLLNKNGLALFQSPTTDGNVVTVTGTLYHLSGESLSSVLTATAKDSLPQSIGSAITYLRRYQMCSMLGVAAEDDDGAAASGTDTVGKVKTAAQEKGPFSHAKPFDQFKAEKSESATPEGEKPSQQDLGSFKDFITAGSIAKVGPVSDKTKLPAWTLYRINTEGHGVISTFSKTVYEEAGKAKGTGKPVMIHCEPGKDGPIIGSIEQIKEEAK